MAAGYTEFGETSSCGDSPHGSREYWWRPESAEHPRFRGFPQGLGSRGCMSRIGGRWYVSL